MDKLSPLAASIARSLRQASALCRAAQRRIGDGPMTKDDKSPVTLADFGSQALIARALAESSPDVPLVAEEDSTDLNLPKNAGTLALALELVRAHREVSGPDELREWIDWGRPSQTPSKFWTLDPIDGTKGFLRGGQYAIALALIDEGQVELAFMACPSLGPGEGQLFVAARGRGAWAFPLDEEGATGTRLAISAVDDPTLARFCERIEGTADAKDESANAAAILGIVRPPLRMDSQAKYAAVARGEVEIYLRLPSDKSYQEKTWDHAAGALVLTEAGGTVTDALGRAIDWTKAPALSANQGIVATNGRFHDQVVRAVGR